MNRPPILLDCDPGIDDAFAIMCALRHTELLAITTVSGNVGLPETTRNARYILELAGAATIPVYAGAAGPIAVDSVSAARVHGRSGLGDLDVPEPTRPAETDTAAEAIARFASSHAPLTVVATGPLTNLAHAIIADRSIVSKIAEISWMGGSIGPGNVTAEAEFNAWADPDAADIVFRSTVPLRMFGLNLTRQVRMSTPHVDRLRAAGTPTAMRAADFLEYYEAHGDRRGLGQPMHDPCAVLGVTHRDLFVFEERNSLVVTRGDMRGKISVSEAPTTGSARIVVATSAASDRVIEEIVDAAIDPAGAT